MNRTSRPILAVLIAAAGLLALSSLAAAQTKAGKAPAKKKAVQAATYTGDLTKVAGKKGKITAAQIKTADEKMLSVVLDKQGLKMAKTLADKKVEVSAVAFTKGKGKTLKTWLRIKTFKEAPAAAEPAGDEGGADEEGTDAE